MNRTLRSLRRPMSRCFWLRFPALAQDETEKAIEKYRQMLKEDPWSNPGTARCRSRRGAVDDGARTKQGVARAVRSRQGAGRVEGAFAELPRYFADAGPGDGCRDAHSVVHGEAAGLQPRRPRQAAASRRRPAGQGARRDRDLRRQQVERHEVCRQGRAPKEKDAVALGEALFFRRSGPFDFSCATCQRRRQAHPAAGIAASVEAEEARKVVGEWPAYRVSSTHVMTMQHRLYDCYWQMRMPELELGSEVSVALIAYLTKTAEGGEIAAPGLKR